ncbi:MAG TPA: hydrogenase maturation nickel metallochaperone HypA [Chloroflexia bacterium]|nr:hydrogenase maturation nickel metallochaperone HypA [Chloroflexia bacterium]
MHESGLMQEIVREVTQAAAQNGGGRVVSVRLRAGVMSPYGDDAIRAHFEHMAEGTLAEGALLVIEHDEDPRSPIAQGVVVETIEVEESAPLAGQEARRG